MNAIQLRRLLRTGCLALCAVLGAAIPAAAQTGCVGDKWTEVPGAGITNGTAPAATVLGADLHLFVTGGNDGIFTNVFRAGAGGWSGWSELPGGGQAGGSSPAAAVYRGTLYTFVLGPTGLIYVNSLKPGGWAGWTEVPGGGRGTEGLAASVFQRLGASDELDLFVRGTDGAIYLNTLSGAAWSGWSAVPGGGITTHGPAAVGFGNLYLYVRGIGGGIYENVRDLSTGGWSGWSAVPGGGITTAAPGVAAGHTAGLFLVVRGLGSGLFRNVIGPGGDGTWTPLPGDGRASATAGPAVVVYQSAFQVFVGGPDDRIICLSP